MEQNSKFKIMHELVYDLKNNEDEFEFFVRNNYDELILLDPILFIGLHVDFYLQRDNISLAIETISSYKNGKYISMEVEEFLDELKSNIFKDIEKDRKDSLTIEKGLTSKKFESNVKAIALLSKKDINEYIPLVESFLKSQKNVKLHRLMLLNLVAQNIDKEFTFYLNSVGEIINPSKLILPEKEDIFNKVIYTLNSSNQKNPSKCRQKLDIYMSLRYILYPYNPFKNMELDLIVDYVDYLCDYVIDNSCLNKNKRLDESKIEELKSMLLN